MTQINLYKIHEDERELFIKSIARKYRICAQKILDGMVYRLFIQYSDEQKDVSWKWAFDLFEKRPLTIPAAPKGMLLIEGQQTEIERQHPECLYAITFGSAFFDVDAYADRDFAFEFGSKVGYSKTKLTSTVNTSPSKNKTINSFRNFDHLEINSGESYTKIKAVLDAESASSLISDVVEVGTSLKFSLKAISFEDIRSLIEYVEQTLTGRIKTKIPAFNLVTNKAAISQHEQALQEHFLEDGSNIVLSEFDIMGTDEVFCRADSYEYMCNGAKKTTSSFDVNELIAFWNESNIESATQKLQTKVGFWINGRRTHTRPLHDLIDYLYDEGKVLLNSGKWYKYNDDFLLYLKESLDELLVIYDSHYDLTEDALDRYRNRKYEEIRIDSFSNGMSEESIRGDIRRRFYDEYVFNLLREEEGFELWDKRLTSIGGSGIEICDLKKDDVIYSVKRGKSSSDLCYVVTQSEMAIEAFRHKFTAERKPKKVVLWLIFQCANHYPMKNGKLDWDAVGMLLLKTRIDSWKKKARQENMVPEIWINYQS